MAVKQTETQTGVVCPHCKEFIPEPITNTLKTKVAWYLKGKDPKKGAKPIKIIRYSKTPKIGSHLTFRDSTYKVIDIKDSKTGDAHGTVELEIAGKHEPIKTQIQDKVIVVEKTRH